jgi:hypothetical protein
VAREEPPTGVDGACSKGITHLVAVVQGIAAVVEIKIAAVVPHSGPGDLLAERHGAGASEADLGGGDGLHGFQVAFAAHLVNVADLQHRQPQRKDQDGDDHGQ